MSVYDAPAGSPAPVEPGRSRRRWIWWLLGFFGASFVACCGGCGALFFWAASAKPIEMYNPDVQRRGATVQITLDYFIKGRSPTIGATYVVVEGPDWRHRQAAFHGFRVPVNGQITVQIGPQNNRPREAGPVSVHLETESPRGDLDRSSNVVRAILPPLESL